MLGFEIPEKLPGWADLPLPHVLQTLTNALGWIGAGGRIEEALISFGVLYDGSCFPFDRKHHWPLGFLDLFHEIAGSAPKGRQRLDVFRDVKHSRFPLEHLFRCDDPLKLPSRLQLGAPLQRNECGSVLQAEARMKKWIGIGSLVIGLVAASACNRRDADRARSESREAGQKARRQLDEASQKAREELKRADQQTREDLDKARDQLHQALNQSERDAQKARDRLRDRTKEDDSHQ